MKRVKKREARWLKEAGEAYRRKVAVVREVLEDVAGWKVRVGCSRQNAWHRRRNALRLMGVLGELGVVGVEWLPHRVVRELEGLGRDGMVRRMRELLDWVCPWTVTRYALERVLGMVK